MLAAVGPDSRSSWVPVGRWVARRARVPATHRGLGRGHCENEARGANSASLSRLACTSPLNGTEVGAPDAAMLEPSNDHHTLGPHAGCPQRPCRRLRWSVCVFPLSTAYRARGAWGSGGPATGATPPLCPYRRPTRLGQGRRTVPRAPLWPRKRSWTISNVRSTPRECCRRR